MPPIIRKSVLSAHILASVGWMGAVIVYLVCVAVAWNTSDLQVLQAMWIAIGIIGWYVIVPLSIIAFVSGIVQSLGTKWGLFRHYWVLISLILTFLAMLILLLHMPEVSQTQALVLASDNVTRIGLASETLHAGIGFLVLLLVHSLNVFKPSGLTPYGWQVRQKTMTQKA